MNRAELLKLHEQITAKARKMMEGKNQDYAAGTGDPFANFRATEVLGIKAEIGILMRCMDKFARIQSFVKNGTLAVKAESVMDAIEDTINYMVLLAGVIEDRAGLAKAVALHEMYSPVFEETAIDRYTKEESRCLERKTTHTEAMYQNRLRDLKDIKELIRDFENNHTKMYASNLIEAIKAVLQRV